MIVDSAPNLSAGYPMISYYHNPYLFGISLKSSGVNGTGQVPIMPGNWGLIDKDTPQELHLIKSSYGGGDLQLVFSDEFNQDSRSFYPGDDPYWEAVDLHYWWVSFSLPHSRLLIFG